ncbi:sugar phosphate isomerase/epimerase family protein [Flavitalea flava]
MNKLTYSCLLCFSALIGLSACNDQPKQAEEKKSDSTTVAVDARTITKDWKIGVQLWTFRLFTFVQAIDKADSAGVKFVEAFPGMKLGGDMKESFGPEMTPESRAKIKKLLQSKGIQIVALGVISPKNMAEWKTYFDLAKDFGLSYITAEPLKDQWNALDSLAGSYGIKVAIHDHPKPNAYWHPDSVLAAVQGHPNIGSCADVGHWTRNGLDPVECLKKLEGHIFGVHLKDIDTAGNTHAKDLIVGTGVVPFPGIFKELLRQKFNGMFSIERENNWENNVPDVIQTVKYYNEQVSKL